GKTRGVLEALISKPEDVEADLVVGEDLLVRERSPAAVGGLLRPCRLAPVAAVRAVALDELVEIGTAQALRLEREVLVRSQVVDPDGLRPRLLRAGLAVEEEDVRLHALGVEDAGREAQQGMNLAFLEEVP